MDILDQWMTDLPWFDSNGFDDLLQNLSHAESLGLAIEPPAEDILYPYRFLSMNDIQTVILSDVRFTDPLLVDNVMMEISLDHGEPPESRSITQWVHQGVFMINTTPASILGDSEILLEWDDLIDETIYHIAQQLNNISFMFWGEQALLKQTLVSRRQHFVSANTGPTGYTGFFGSRPFSKTNAYLTEYGKSEIKWGAD